MADMIQCGYDKCRMRNPIFKALYYKPEGKHFCNTSCLTLHLNRDMSTRPHNVLQPFWPKVSLPEPG